MNYYRGKDYYRGQGFQSGTAEANIEPEFYIVLQKAVSTGQIPQFHTRKEITLMTCIPDFTWDEEKTILEWDGPPHDRPKQAEDDDVKNSILLHQGWKVIRIHYDGGKVSNKKKTLVLDWLIEVLADSRRGRLWEYDLEAMKQQ